MELRIYPPTPEPTTDEERQRIRYRDLHEIVDYDDWIEEEIDRDNQTDQKNKKNIFSGTSCPAKPH